ncbi:MAG TPA: sigma-70 family RNA polymerase sigma factor [Gammaproteobacteria bacterium]|nr:sigma-70 family RNA polymerase sigma factor [Gammaproteobacteria bacterium]
MSYRPRAGDYLLMSLSRSVPHDSVTADTESAVTPNQDDLYARAAAALGPSLARLAAAYELDRAHREDLLQNIHLALWRSFATFDAKCSLRTWAYRVAHNTAATHVLRHKRARLSQLVSLEELAEMPDEADHERLVDEATVIERLRTLVRRLKPIDRDVLLLYLEGMEAAEIADVVGISASNVAQKVHRTKKLLRSHFQSGDDHADRQ